MSMKDGHCINILFCFAGTVNTPVNTPTSNYCSISGCKDMISCALCKLLLSFILHSCTLSCCLFQENVADLHSNVVDLAREISHYVDPENVLPSVRCCHQLNSHEVKRVVEILGSQNQLQEHKPQNYLFAVLPANNHMHSVLFDYTGTFRPSPEDQEVCQLPMPEEEDRFATPPTTLTDTTHLNQLVGAVHI